MTVAGLSIRTFAGNLRNKREGTIRQGTLRIIGETTAAAIAHGVAPNVVMETGSPEAMKRLAEVGMGVAILPEALVRPDIAAGRLRRLHVAEARFERSILRDGGTRHCKNRECSEKCASDCKHITSPIQSVRQPATQMHMLNIC